MCFLCNATQSHNHIDKFFVWFVLISFIAFLSHLIHVYFCQFILLPLIVFPCQMGDASSAWSWVLRCLIDFSPGSSPSDLFLLTHSISSTLCFRFPRILPCPPCFVILLILFCSLSVFLLLFDSICCGCVVFFLCAFLPFSSLLLRGPPDYKVLAKSQRYVSG